MLLGVSEESKAYRLYNPLTKKIVVSRDVVFEENESWDWDKSGKEIRSDVLEWGEKEEDTMAREEESESDEENGEQVQDEGAVISSSSSGSLDTEEDSLPEKRNRMVPYWSKDYVTGEGLSGSKEHAQNLVLYTSSEDPCSFEEANRSVTWRDAMDKEMGAIEKNGTWELTDLPEGARKIGVKWIFKTKLMRKGRLRSTRLDLWQKGMLSNMVLITQRYLCLWQGGTQSG